jgi:hypothetical protein
VRSPADDIGRTAWLLPVRGHRFERDCGGGASLEADIASCTIELAGGAEEGAADDLRAKMQAEEEKADPVLKS